MRLDFVGGAHFLSIVIGRASPTTYMRSSCTWTAHSTPFLCNWRFLLHATPVCSSRRFSLHSNVGLSFPFFFVFALIKNII